MSKHQPQSTLRWRALAFALGLVITSGSDWVIAQRRLESVDTPVASLRAAALADELAWERLSYLCDRIGARSAGSDPFLKAVAWGQSMFRRDQLDEVMLEPVTTERWRRGRERLVVTEPVVRELPMLGLGLSVGTPGIEAPVVVIKDLAQLGQQVKGAIVAFVPEVPAEASAGARYGIFGRYRRLGPSAAARHGAIAVLVRSAPLRSLATPHTGVLSYDEGVAKIPSAAISAEDGDWLARLAWNGVTIKARLEMEAAVVGPVETANVLGEIRGSEKPEEIVLIGAHLDSWDVGQGAHDDGVGVIHVIETLRLIKSLGLVPRRTIRGVLFVNEEHGLDGGKAYALAHENEKHVAALESDLGGGEPKVFGVSGTPEQTAWFLGLTAPTGLPVQLGGGGVDISPLTRRGVMSIGYYPDTTTYFDLHHTNADVLESVDPRLLRAGLAAIAVLTWQLATAP
jgi:carboxypeptidase Q